MRKKAIVLNKQADIYNKVVDEIIPNIVVSKETPLGKYGITFIGDSLSLNRKEFNRYIINYEEYLTVTAEKLRSEIIGLVIFIYRVEKRLKDAIQLKVVVDYKIYYNIKLFRKFEIRVQ